MRPEYSQESRGFSDARDFNIESLNVAETQEPGTSRITLVTTGDEAIIQQIIKRFNNMVNVIKVVDMTELDRVEREMILIKVDAKADSKPEILRIADIFRAKVVDVSPRSYTFEVTGDEEKIQAFVELQRPFGGKGNREKREPSPCPGRTRRASKGGYNR